VHNAVACPTLTTFEEGRGHHIFAKKAFEGVEGYDKNKALVISAAELERLGLNHLDTGGITATQQRLFRELAASRRPNTLQEHARIAIESLVAGGLERAQAEEVVQRALDQLRSWGITAPSRIPWGG
jgi:hypothetical protein